MFTDLRQALRVLLKSPGFSAVVVVVLAVGIGANTAIFSIVNGVLLKPLPFADASRLVVDQRRSCAAKTTNSASFPDFTDWRAQIENDRRDGRLRRIRRHDDRQRRRRFASDRGVDRRFVPAARRHAARRPRVERERRREGRGAGGPALGDGLGESLRAPSRRSSARRSRSTACAAPSSASCRPPSSFPFRPSRSRRGCR